MPQAFPNLEGLVRLSHNQGIDIRRPLLRVLTDLYVQERTHTREQELQYVELALRLLPAVDVPTRAAVARKLAVYASAPAQVIEALGRDVPEVAAFVRRALPASFPAAQADGAAIPDAAAAERHEPAPGRAASPPLPAWDSSESIGEFFLRAEPAQRIALLEASAEAEDEEPAEAPALPERAGAIARLERAALRREGFEFVRELQHALGISARTAWRIAQDGSGEPLAVAAKALGMEADVLIRIMLFQNPAIGESVERVFSLARLYEQLTPGAVAPIIAAWRADAAARAAARFQPALAPDGSDSAARARESARGSRDEAASHRPAHPPAERRTRGQGTT